jgi:hypothetical protein
MDLSFDHNDFDELELSKEIVAAVSDLPTLCGWYETLTEKSMQVSSFVSAFRHAQVDDDDWYRRSAGKLGFCNVGLKWVEQRILQLGGEPPYPLADPRNKQIRILLERVKKLTGKAFEEPAS